MKSPFRKRYFHAFELGLDPTVNQANPEKILPDSMSGWITIKYIISGREKSNLPDH